eukprot:3702789-Rhodomonas_salina.2
MLVRSQASTASFKLPPIPAPATLDGEVESTVQGSMGSGLGFRSLSSSCDGFATRSSAMFGTDRNQRQETTVQYNLYRECGVHAPPRSLITCASREGVRVGRPGKTRRIPLSCVKGCEFDVYHVRVSSAVGENFSLFSLLFLLLVRGGAQVDFPDFDSPRMAFPI